MRKKRPINNDWMFKKGRIISLVENDPSMENFERIRIPHNMVDVPLSGFDHHRGEIIGTYVKELDSIEVPSHHELHIDFSGVMTRTEVFWNDKQIGVHEGGYTPFSFKVPKEFIKDHNRLIVFVDGGEIPNIPPFGDVVDYLPYSGIYREVELSVLPTPHIEYLKIRTKEMNEKKHNTMVLEGEIIGDISSLYPLEAIVTLCDDDDTVIERTFTFDQNTCSFSMKAGPIERWSLDHPYLYDLTLRLEKNGQDIDEITKRFGFRSAHFAEDGFYLNGDKINLIGLNRHQSYPYVGYAMPLSMQRKDADRLKCDLGCNIVRTSHYMQSDHFINRCDEIGLLVFEEIPGWQHIGDDHFKSLTYENLRVMINHHFNHPSIVLWGVRINESADDHAFYMKTNELAHQLDDTRQTGGVRNFTGSELLEDVYTMNDFSHTGSNRGLLKKRHVTKRDVPYLVTEYNGHMFPVKKFDPERKREEQALRHANVLEAAFADEGIAGAIGWCMFDYNTHPQFGSGDMICHHGVMDMFRIPKPAASIYASQSDHHVVLDVLSEMTMGEHPKSVLDEIVVATNCDYVEVYHSGNFIDRFFPAHNKYGHLPHPPVFINDLIGERLSRETQIRPRTIALLKKVFAAYEKHGMDMPLLDKFHVFRLMVFHKFSMADITDIYTRFVGDWGDDGGEYKFVGFKNGHPVKTAIKGPSKSAYLTMEADDMILHDSSTYDATRVVVRLVDQNNNDIRFSFHPVCLETSSELTVMGPKIQSLIDGSVGFFVKTTGQQGQATINATCEGYDEVSLKIDVR